MTVTPIPTEPTNSAIERQQLKHKALKGMFWSMCECIGQQGIQFLIGIILARLLSPGEFGLTGMLTIFMALGQSFIDSGFSQALIQKRNATHTDECSIFYFNILVGTMAAGVMCMAAPWIAAFYHQPLLTPLTRALSLNLFFSSFGAIQLTLLTKRIDFKTQTKRTMLATLLSGLAGVTLAWRGFGVWSLVAQSMIRTLLNTVFFWYFSTWRPSLLFSLASLRSMFTFGSRMLLSGLLDTIYSNIYLVIIGKLFSPADLGLYARAQQTQQLPVANLASVVQRVMFPVFSMLQNDKVALRRAVRKSLTTLVMVNFPLMMALAVLARPLVLLILTPKWAACIPYLQLLCVVGLVFPLHVVNLDVLIAQGRSDLFFRLELCKKACTTVMILVTWRWGITALIYGQFVQSLIAFFLNSYYTGQMLDYPMRHQVMDLLPYLGAALLMGLGIHGLSYVPVASMILVLGLQVVAGVVIYVTLCRLFKLPTFMEMSSTLRVLVAKPSRA